MRDPGQAIGFFAPCYVDELWPSAGRAALELIEALGVPVEIADPVCCGQAMSNAGDSAGADAVLGAWLSGHRGFDTVVVLSASCAGFLQRALDTHDTLDTHDGPVPRVYEFCDWFLEHAPNPWPGRFERRLALHASCSSLRETGTAAATREVLERIDGLELVDALQPEECCGFGGSFSTSFAELSVRMGCDKVDHLLANGGVDGVVSADCSCMLHLQSVAPESLRFFHVAEVLQHSLTDHARVRQATSAAHASRAGVDV